MTTTITPDDLIEALESGQYKKGTGQLRSDIPKSTKATYCCLGVACEIAGVGYNPASALANWEQAPPWAPWLSTVLQRELASINDRSGPSFRPVINRLRKVQT